MKLWAADHTHLLAPMRRHLLAMTAALSVGTSACSREIQMGLELRDDDRDAGTVVWTVPECPSMHAPSIARACVLDSAGKSYAEQGSGDIAVATAPPYGTYVLFDTGCSIDIEDVGTVGPEASVKVAAAPCYRGGDHPCFPEYDESKRIAAHATLSAEGGVLVTVREALPSGTQVVVAIEIGALFRTALTSRDGATCANTSGSVMSGFDAVFYVGSPLTAEPDKS